MTCYVNGLEDGQHIHFIDGGDGGYAVAAKQLKQQLMRDRRFLSTPTLNIERSVFCRFLQRTIGEHVVNLGCDSPSYPLVYSSMAFVARIQPRMQMRGWCFVCHWFCANDTCWGAGSVRHIAFARYVSHFYRRQGQHEHICPFRIFE